MIVSPSLLSADFTILKQQLQAVEKTRAKWIHFDVMDGHFVNNISFGPDLLKAVKRCSSLFCDVHLMISDPLHYAPVFCEAGADLITFHLDAMKSEEDIQNLIKLIHDNNKQTGIVTKPKHDISEYYPYLSQVELALVMSVEPGFGGQSFQPEAIDKIRKLKTYREQHQLDFLIQVDGGINAETGRQAVDAGADVLVAGSYIFRQDIARAVDSLWID